MESLSETEWDVVISGTGLQQSLLALALSRSGKKVLHVDANNYYGGAEAAFSLQEIEEWVEIVNANASWDSFSNASIWKPDNSTGASNDAEKLSFSRAYSLNLSPRIIYSRSKLISQLVSSKAYRQLEFQAVGNWWIYTAGSTRDSGEIADLPPVGNLKRIPNGREDVTFDKTIDLHAKRGLMKFLNFVVDYENKTEIWEPYADSSLGDFISAQFRFPQPLQTTILALTLSLDLPSKTTVRYSLPRIARHLTSIGVFGPGFGAVIPKWGGMSEITQIACRAGAVGGGVYVLGTGVVKAETQTTSEIVAGLTNKESVRTKFFIKLSEPHTDNQIPVASYVSRMATVVSSDLGSLFTSTVEGGPAAAVSVVVFPSNSILVDREPQAYPVYVMVHSSDTGECPVGQSVIYASTLTAGNPKSRLEAAITALISSYSTTQNRDIATSATLHTQPKVLLSVYYEQARVGDISNASNGIFSLAFPPVDLAFEDAILDNVKDAWRMVIGLGEHDQVEEENRYMIFEDPEPVDIDDSNGR